MLSRTHDLVMNGRRPVHRARVVMENMAELMREYAGDFLAGEAAEQPRRHRYARVVGGPERIGVHAGCRQQKQLRHPLQSSADTYVQQNRVEVGCIRALQRLRAKGLKDRLRLAMRGVHSGADFSERRLGLTRFAGRLPAQDQQSDQIVHDRMRMTRMCVACPTPTLAPEGPDSSVRPVAFAKPLRIPPRRLAAEALAAMHSTVTPAAASLAATKSENWNPGRRQHESLPNTAPG